MYCVGVAKGSTACGGAGTRSVTEGADAKQSRPPQVEKINRPIRAVFSCYTFSMKFTKSVIVQISSRSSSRNVTSNADSKLCAKS